MAKCPECGTRLTIEVEVQRGDQIICTTCESVLDVLNVRPLELEVVSKRRSSDDLNGLEWDDDEELEEDDEDIEDLTLDDEEWD